MGKIVLHKVRQRANTELKGIKVGNDVYDRLDQLNKDTGLSIARLATLFIEEALKDVVVIDPETESDPDGM